MEAKPGTSCFACGKEIREVDPAKVVRIGSGWVNYPCQHCGHIQQVYLEGSKK